MADLARGLIQRFGQGPEALGEVTLLLPTRRAARALAEALLAAGDRAAVLLPQVRPLGDLEAGEAPFEPGDLGLDLPPAIAPLHRRFELARLVTQADLPELIVGEPRRALGLADALAGLLDSVLVEERLEPEAFETLVDDTFARHWQVSARALAVVLRRWPQRLAELGLMDAVTRQVALLRRLIAQWQERPPSGPVVAAGSTGSGPAVADLLGLIAGLPQGSVVLPGLDLNLPDAAWDRIDDAHPQAAMRDLLAGHGVARGEVRSWIEASQTPGLQARERLFSLALTPPAATGDWRRRIDDTGAAEVLSGTRGLSLIRVADDEAAAAAIAVALRQGLETPGRTVALVTPDLNLARRVTARLSRWGLVPDSSAGVALAGTPAGLTLSAAAGLLAAPEDPSALMAVLKRPGFDLGLEPEAALSARLALERLALRGPRPRAKGEDTIRARLQRAHQPDSRGRVPADWLLAEVEAALDLHGRLIAALPELDRQVGVDQLAEALVRLIEAGQGDQAWSGADGEAVARMLADLIAHGAALPPLVREDIGRLIDQLLSEQTVRQAGDSHPRLRILGALEARLVRADLMVLAGLEEGVWPRGAPLDPFLSRPMRRRLGLPQPERRQGLSAHDFVQAAMADQVILVNRARVGEDPALESRWLWRLQTVLRGAGSALPEARELRAWAEALDRTPGPPRPIERPSPSPPVAARPTRWSVTDIETLTRDPYAIWARKILRLEALSPVDEAVDARLRGSAIHAAFEAYAQALNAGEPADADRFEALYVKALADGGTDEAGLVRERALGRRIAAWAETFEAERRQAGVRVLIEQQGAITVPVAGRSHGLSARADRIEVTRDGLAHVLDIKTGQPPTGTQMTAGYSPQLTLTGAILARGGFREAGRVQPGELVYVRVSGRQPPGEVMARATAAEGAALSEAAYEGLVRLLTLFERDDWPYQSRIAPHFVKLYPSDYAHLARVAEWSATASEGEP